MPELLDHDVYWCVRRLPKEVFNLIKLYPSSLAIAGGYIRACIAKEPVSDIDLFSPNKDSARAMANQLASMVAAKTNTERPAIWSTDNAFTVKVSDTPVQFIHRWTFEGPEDVIKSFDFTVACAILYRKRNADHWVWGSLCDERFYADLAAKRLVYRSPVRQEEVGGSMLRVLKFYQRGYTIPLDSLGAVIARLTTKITQEGIEAACTKFKMTPEQGIAWAVTGLLREVDPLIDPNSLDHLETEAGLTGHGGLHPLASEQLGDRFLEAGGSDPDAEQT